MDKKETFKNFAKSHPELINTVRSNEMTWQKLYEIYDIYGEDDGVWQKYFSNKDTNNTMGSITDIVKNIDMESVQKHINTAQKALGIVQELTGKGASNVTSKIPVAPRPINNFFED